MIKPIKYITDTVGNVNSDNPIVLRDTSNIMELHILSQEINNMSEKIYAYNQAQKNFFHNASHELRTPLTSIQGYAEGIEQGFFIDNTNPAKIIIDETKRLSCLVSELLSLSRMENFAVKQNLEVFILSEIIQDQLQRMNSHTLKNQKEIKLQILSDSKVLINEELMSQAFTNIVFNSIRYAKKHITITLNTNNKRSIIKISDNGNGIKQEDLPYIFDKFYKGEYGNFGLGLSISKVAVENMGGIVSAENGKHGAIFTLSLPSVE